MSNLTKKLSGSGGGGISPDEKGQPNGVAALDSNAKIIASQLDIALDSDIVAQTADKLLDATRVSDDATMINNSATSIVSERAIVNYINNATAGTSKFRGGLSGNADLTGNSTGNVYIDSVTSYFNGDYFNIISDGNLIVNDGNIPVKSGENIKFSNDVTKAQIIIIDIYVDTAPTAATYISNIPYGTITGTNVQEAIDELDDKKLAKNELISYGIYKLTASTSSYKNIGDHCPFNTTRIHIDPANLQTLGTLTYTTNNGVHCKGRVKLKAGYYYKITGFVSTIGNSPFLGFSLYDVTTPSTIQIGTFASTFASQNQSLNVNCVPSFAFVQANIDILIELRITGGNITYWYMGNNNLSECSMIVEVVGKI